MERITIEKDMKGPNPATVDEYIAMQPEKFRSTLEALRSIIKSEVPEATESISYMVPCFKYLYMLIGIGVTKQYCSLYGMSTDLPDEFREALKSVKVSGKTLHFPPGEPLPEDLIRAIVRARKAQNVIKAMKRKK